MPDPPKKADPRSIRQQKITKRTMGGDCSRSVRAQQRKLPASRRHLYQIPNPKETKKHPQQQYHPDTKGDIFRTRNTETLPFRQWTTILGNILRTIRCELGIPAQYQLTTLSTKQWIH